MPRTTVRAREAKGLIKVTQHVAAELGLCAEFSLSTYISHIYASRKGLFPVTVELVIKVHSER